MKNTMIMEGLEVIGRRRYVCKGVKVAAAAGLCLAVWWFAATAVYTNEAIKSMTATVTSSVVTSGDGGGVSAITNGTKYHVVSCDFTSGKSQWKAGDMPKVSIELATEEGYYFNNINAPGAHIREANYMTSKKSDAKQGLAIMAKLKGVRGTLDRVEGAYWEEKSLSKARWVKAKGASSYEVKLFRGRNMVYHVPRTNLVSYDFFPCMIESGDYYFKVRAIVRSGLESGYLKAGNWAESKNQEVIRKNAQAADKRSVSTGIKGVNEKDGMDPQSQASGWVQDQNGWQHKNEDKTHPVGKRNMIGDKWCLFDMSGYILTGWQWKNDREYYLISDGDMVTGQFQYNRIWYYLDPEQGRFTGAWLQQGDDWYYLNPDGSMATRRLLSRDSQYYLDPRDSQMVKDQVVGEYYTGQNGIWTP